MHISSNLFLVIITNRHCALPKQSYISYDATSRPGYHLSCGQWPSFITTLAPGVRLHVRGFDENALNVVVKLIQIIRGVDISSPWWYPFDR